MRPSPALVAVALLAGCPLPDRQPIDAPLALGLAETPPVQLADGTVIEVRRAVFAVADLELLDRRGEVVGAWAAARVVEVSQGPEGLGSARLLEADPGEAPVQGRFRLAGEPALELRGVALLPGGGEVPFDFAPDLDVEVPVGVALEEVDAAPPPDLRWSLDLAFALGEVDWAAGLSHPPLRAEGPTRVQLLDGLLDRRAWRVVDVRATAR